MKQVQELLHQQMTRKEFMKLFSLALLALFGVNNFISFLTSRAGIQSNGNRVASKADANNSFGTRKFGA